MREATLCGIVITTSLVLLTSFFSGCQSYMASCDGEACTEEVGKSLRKLSVVKWSAKPEWKEDDKNIISLRCGLTEVSNNVVSVANLGELGESSLPVKILITSSTIAHNNGAIATIWNVPAFLSLAILPIIESDKEAYTIQAETVVGKHEKTVEICNRTWYSIWTPLALVPVPGWADFRAIGDSGDERLNEYHAQTLAAFTVQLLSEVAEADWPKYNSDRTKYDKIISFENSDETIRAALDLIRNMRQDETHVVNKGRVVKYSKYNWKGKYRGERYKIVGNPSISEYKEFHSESEAEDAIADSLSDLESRRRGALVKIAQDELMAARKLAEVKDVSVIEKYEEELKKKEAQVKSSELRRSLAELLGKLRLKRNRDLAEKLLKQRDWQRLRELCTDEKNEGFVALYGPKAEQLRVEEVSKEMKDALAKGDWQHALALSKNENDKIIKELAARAEQIRLEEVRKKMQDALAQGDWQHALSLSKNESDKTIKTLAVKAEQIRVKTKCAEINDALNSRDWKTALKLCQGEKDETIEILEKKAGELRDSIKNEKLAECRKLLAEKKWDDVITVASEESGDELREIVRQATEAKNAALKEARVAKLLEDAKSFYAEGKWQKAIELLGMEKDDRFKEFGREIFDDIPLRRTEDDIDGIDQLQGKGDEIRELIEVATGTKYIETIKKLDEAIAESDAMMEKLVGLEGVLTANDRDSYNKLRELNMESRVSYAMLVVNAKAWMTSEMLQSNEFAKASMLCKEVIEERGRPFWVKGAEGEKLEKLNKLLDLLQKAYANVKVCGDFQIANKRWVTIAEFIQRRPRPRNFEVNKFLKDHGLDGQHIMTKGTLGLFMEGTLDEHFSPFAYADVTIAQGFVHVKDSIKTDHVSDDLGVQVPVDIVACPKEGMKNFKEGDNVYILGIPKKAAESDWDDMASIALKDVLIAGTIDDMVELYSEFKPKYELERRISTNNSENVTWQEYVRFTEAHYGSDMQREMVWRRLANRDVILYGTFLNFERNIFGKPEMQVSVGDLKIRIVIKASEVAKALSLKKGEIISFSCVFGKRVNEFSGGVMISALSRRKSDESLEDSAQDEEKRRIQKEFEGREWEW